MSTKTYTYAKTGALASVTEDGASISYTYDGAGRLTQEVTGSTTISYVYDARGNRTSKADAGTTTTYTYDNANKLLTETTGNTTKTYTYDANGNLLSDGTVTYTYDVRNRQISYLSGTTAATYTYHPDNLRKSKTVNGSTTNFVWADGNLVHEYTNTSTKTYFYAIILVSDSAGQAYLYNTHGDVIKLIGTLTWDYTYDAYGVQQNPDPLDGNAFRYAGQYFDIESGTYYLRARYYSPATGRFTQQDAWTNANRGDPLGLNLYCYCVCNPVRYWDPWGQKPGDRFESVDAAAIDFAEQYNGKSIEEDIEYGSVIYQVTIYDEIEVKVLKKFDFLFIHFTYEVTTYEYIEIDHYYSYSEPITGDVDKISISIDIPRDHTDNSIAYKHIEKAQIHTHGALQYGSKTGGNVYEYNGFSKSDITAAKKRKVDTYVVTPWGHLFKATYKNNYSDRHEPYLKGFTYDPLVLDYFEEWYVMP